ncbi:MAG: 4-(cytidine 5'-diphospho)-2-C-methyl-D-erythritol kinase [Alphaproteobacteria bacterium]
MSKIALYGRAEAKLNLDLRITGIDDKNYHLLSSTALFIDLYDSVALTLYPADQAQLCPAIDLKLTGDFAQYLHPESLHDNLAVRAIGLFHQLFPQFSRFTYALALTKDIPIGAGLAGGTSDAITCLYMLAAHHHVLDQVRDHSLIALGADAPLLWHGKLQAQPILISGMGDRLTKADQPLPLFDSIHLVIAFTNEAVSTKGCFDHYDQLVMDGKIEFSPLNIPLFDSLFKQQAWDAASLAGVLAQSHNDLQIPAIGLQPEIGHLLNEMRQDSQCHFAQMTGSGAACFGLFSSKQAAHNHQAHLHSKSYWATTARIL